MSIWFQNLASIQRRTSLVKFARSPRTDPPGWTTIKRTIGRWLSDDGLQASDTAHPSLKLLVESGYEADREHTVWDPDFRLLTTLLGGPAEYCNDDAQLDDEGGCT